MLYWLLRRLRRSGWVCLLITGHTQQAGTRHLDASGVVYAKCRYCKARFDE